MEAILELSRSGDREATTAHEAPTWDAAAPWRELFEGVAAGRQEALARLYDAASKRMFGLALWRTGNTEDAGEVVQEAFVRVVEHRDRLAAVEDPRWWLIATTHRIAVDVTRRRRPTEPIEEHPYLQSPAGDQDRQVDARRVSALIARLSPKQREVIYLHHYAGMSHSEVARSLGIPTFTAASRYRLGIAALRRLLGRAP